MSAPVAVDEQELVRRVAQSIWPFGVKATPKWWEWETAPISGVSAATILIHIPPVPVWMHYRVCDPRAQPSLLAPPPAKPLPRQIDAPEDVRLQEFTLGALEGRRLVMGFAPRNDVVVYFFLAESSSLDRF